MIRNRVSSFINRDLTLNSCRLFRLRMGQIKSTLENRLNNIEPFQLKSNGEREIAYFLEKNLIDYQYEKSVVVNTDDFKQRIWYPDFYLPEFGAYIEYYGLAGQTNYDKGIKVKEDVYSKMGMEVIPVYPWMFAENWQDYIMTGLKRSIVRKLKTLNTKPYWLNQDRLPYHRTMPPQMRYNQKVKQHY